MRRFDKTKNILKANILAEQRYLESKGLIKEGEDFGTGENFGLEDKKQSAGINHEIGNDENVNTDIKYYIDKYLDIYFDVKEEKAEATLYDIEIPDSNSKTGKSSVMYVFDIVSAVDSKPPTRFDHPLLGWSDSELVLKFNEAESLLNDEAKKYIDYVEEKIIEDSSTYFEKKSDYENSFR